MPALQTGDLVEIQSEHSDDQNIDLKKFRISVFLNLCFLSH